MYQLSDIAEISFGVYAKTIPASENNVGLIPYLQIGDFDYLGTLQPQKISTFVNEDFNNDKFFLKVGDILLPAKGIRNTALLYFEHYPKAVASSLFFVLRIEDKMILPQFLTIYLNHPNTQAKIKAMISSSVTVPTLNKKDFQKLLVPMLPLIEQEKFIQLNLMQSLERKLTNQILEKKELLLNQLLSNRINDLNF